jgi:hypothetical protein
VTFTLLCAALLLAAGPPPGVGSGFGAPPVLFTIEGYLEHAPKDVPVLARAQLGVGKRRRTLLITGYWRYGGGNRAELVRELGRFDPDFLLQGPASDIASIAGAPAGTRIRGTFNLSRGGLPKLFVTEVVIEPPQ